MKMLDPSVSKILLSKKPIGPAARRAAALRLMAKSGFSQKRPRGLAAERRRYGYWRRGVLPEPEGDSWTRSGDPGSTGRQG